MRDIDVSWDDLDPREDYVCQCCEEVIPDVDELLTEVVTALYSDETLDLAELGGFLRKLCGVVDVNFNAITGGRELRIIKFVPTEYVPSIEYVPIDYFDVAKGIVGVSR